MITSRKIFFIIFLISISLTSAFGFGTSEESSVRDNSNKIVINTFGDISVSLSDQSGNPISLSNNESYTYTPNHEYEIKCSSNNKSVLIKKIEITHTGDYDNTIKIIPVDSAQYSDTITLPETENGITILITSETEGINLKLYNNIGVSWFYANQQYANNSVISILPSSDKLLTLKYDPNIYYLKSTSPQLVSNYDNDTRNGKITIYTKNLITEYSVIELEFASYIFVEPGSSDLTFYKNSNLTDQILPDTTLLKAGETVYASISSKEYYLKNNIDCTIREITSSTSGRKYEITFGVVAEGKIRFDIAKGAKINFDNKTDGICDALLKINNQQYFESKNVTYPMGSSYQLIINSNVPLENNQAICVTTNSLSKYYSDSDGEIKIEGIINTSDFSISITIVDDIYLVKYPGSSKGGSFSIRNADSEPLLPGYSESAKIYNPFSKDGKILLTAFPSVGYYTDWSQFSGKKNDLRAGISYKEVTIKEYTELLNKLPKFIKFSVFELPSSDSSFCNFTFEFNGKVYYPGDTIYFIPGEKLKVTGRLQGDYSFGLIAGQKKTESYDLPVTPAMIKNDFEFKYTGD